MSPPASRSPIPDPEPPYPITPPVPDDEEQPIAAASNEVAARREPSGDGDQEAGGERIGLTSNLPSQFVTFRLPIGNATKPGYISRHVDLQLNQEQAITLKRLVAGLDAAHARLKNGRVVQTAGDTVRWILEQPDRDDH